MALSYSGYNMYVDCPSSFQRRYILKEKTSAEEPTPESAPAMFRGLDMHQAVEDLLNDKRNDLPKEISQYTPFAIGLRTKGASAEEAFAFDSKWERVDFDNPEAEIRGLLDCKLCTDEDLVIYEWKTGKVYESHVHQRSLYGLAALLMHPEHKTVTVITTYFDQGQNNQTVYHRDMLTTYKWVWERHINKTKPPQPYPMKPSWKCRYCDYSKNRGGKCPN